MGRRTTSIVGALALLVFLPTCGFPPSGGSLPSPTTSALSEPLVIVMDSRWGGTTGPQAFRTLHVVNLKGVEVMSIKPSAASSEVSFLGTAQSRIFYVESTPQVDASGHMTSDIRDYTVKSVGRDRRVRVVEALGAHPLGWGGGGGVLSPDGTQRLWTEVTSSPGEADRSQLHLATFGGEDRAIASYDAAPDPYGSWVIAGYQWDAGGAIVAHAAAGWPMPLLMAHVWNAYVLDPESGTLSPLWPGTACTLPARAADGTVACVVRDSGNAAGDYTLNIGKPPYAAVSVRIAASPGLGSLSFEPGPHATELVVGVQRPIQAFPSGGYDHSFGPTSMVDVKTGHVRAFGPAGMMPPNGSWAWLDDGSLIEYNAEPAHADPETTSITNVTYLVSPDGTARRLAVGLPVGVLQG